MAKKQQDLEIKEANRNKRSRELSSLFMFATAVLLAFAYWAPSKASGFLGVALKHLGYGLVGSAAVVFPVILGFLAIDRILDKSYSISTTRQRYLLLIFLLSAVLITVLSLDVDKLFKSAEVVRKGVPVASAWRALGLFWQSGLNPSLVSLSDLWSGGLLGGVLGLALIVLTGKAGATVILIAMIAGLLLVLGNASLSIYLNRTAELVQTSGSKLREGHRQRQAKKQAEKIWQTDQESEAFQAGELEDNEELVPLINQEDYQYDYPLSPGESELSDPHEVSSNWLQSQLTETSESAGEIALSAEDQAKHFVPEYSLPAGDWLIKDETDSEELSTPGPVPPVPTPVAPAHQEPERVPEEGAKSTSSETVQEIAKEIQPADDQVLAGDRSTWADRTESLGVESKPLPVTGRKKISLASRYVPPPIDLLTQETAKQARYDKSFYQEQGAKLELALNSFGIEAKVVNYTAGPTITRFEVAPGPGVKVKAITNLANDIALALAAVGVRIEAPIPGKSAVGIEVPNAEVEPVLLSGLIKSAAFKQGSSKILAALGRDIAGKEILCDLGKMPHLLIAGATGSGKSVCINSILISLLYRSGPEDVKLLMIDPKVVELSVYNGIPHLLQPVVTDPKKAYGVLNWAVSEMTDRYNKFAQNAVRDFAGYNKLVAEGKLPGSEKLPYILILIDELSDLMATTSKEVETAIARLAAMARAAGIHLIIATQRPTVDVITGVIKANIPSRIAFAVASQTDSRTILDINGAESLLGKGDMLYFPGSAAKPLRGQGAFVTDAEVDRVVSYLRDTYAHEYDDDVAKAIDRASATGDAGGAGSDSEEDDELLDDALRLVVESGYASTSMLQRRLSVGYPRASRIIDQLHDRGYIGPFEGSKPRKVNISRDEYLAMRDGDELGD